MRLTLLLCLILHLSQSSSFVRRRGSSLYHNAQTFSFSGVNIYWLGQDENNPDVPDGPPLFSHPSSFRIDDVLTSAKSMGSLVVRSHTLGISTGTGEYHAYHDGWNGTLMPDRETFLEENFASMDYAVYRAGQLGLKLVVPLTDEWNYYHGGMQDFLGWRGQSDIDGELDNCVCNIDQHRQDIFYSHPDIIADFKLYVSRLLNHVNPLTNIAYKDDPTIMAWESGNELYYPTFDWTVELARFIKDDLQAQQLFMDGRMISRTGAYPELSDESMREKYQAVVDIVTDHFYPLSVDKLMETATVVDSLYGLPLVIGEIDWSESANVDAMTFLKTVEDLHGEGLLTGSLFWAMFGHAEIFGHVTHNDRFSIYWPTGPEPDSFHHNNPAYRALMKNFSDHMFLMSGREVPSSYLLSSQPPVISSLECKPGQWVRLGIRGVAGAHLYKVLVDSQPLAFIEDRQEEPTYIHNSVVGESSEVMVVPLGYGEERKEGTPSLSVSCP